MSEKPISNKDKTVHVTEATHTEVKNHLEAEGAGGDIGKFFDKAAVEKLSRLKNQSPFSKIDSQLLFNHGWEKAKISHGAGIDYLRGKDIVKYTGTEWFHNGELLTEENFEEKLNTKTPDV